MSKVEATATTTSTTTSGDNLLLDNTRREESNETLEHTELKLKDDIEEGTIQNYVIEKKEKTEDGDNSTGTSSDEKENSTTKNGSGRSTDDENFVDSVSTNLITRKDIPQDVAIAIKALGELKHSGKIINNLKNNADFVLQNSKMHLAIMNANTNKITRNVTRNIQRSLDDFECTDKQVNRSKRTKLQGNSGAASQRDNDNNSEDDEDRDENDEEDGVEEEDDDGEEEEDGEDATTPYYDPVTGIYSRKRRRARRTRRIKNAIQTHTLNLSIESKKKLFTCLHLLKLANKQLSNKVFGLQELVQQEEEKKKNMQEEEAKQQQQQQQPIMEDHAQALEFKTDLLSTDNTTITRRTSTSSNNSNTRNEIIGTVKKVYTLISKFTGNSLPEPARSKVRESLLTLPGRIQTYISSEDNVVSEKQEHSEPQVKREAQDEAIVLEKHKPRDGSYVLEMMSGNQKMLLLAKESLDMVGSVMDVVDDTLGRAEEWVKQRQELQEQLRENLRKQITNSTSSELQRSHSIDQTGKPIAHVE